MMKYPRMSESILVNHVPREMRSQGISQQQLSRNTGLSRRTIARLCQNPAENFRINTMKEIANSLGVAEKSLYDYKVNYMAFCLGLDPNGFSPENLAILDDYVASAGIELRYQVYSSQRKMNIETKYAGCRRVSFSGNWMFDYYHQPRLTLVDYDVDYSRVDVEIDEIKQLYAKMIRATINYARHVGIDVIEHQIVRSELLPKEEMWRHVPNVAVIRDQMLRQLGFVEYSCARSAVKQLRYRV